MKKTLMTTAAILILALTASAMAEDGPRRGPRKGGQGRQLRQNQEQGEFQRGEGQGFHGRPGRPGGPQQGPMGGIGMALRHLDLTEEQKQQARAIMEEHREAMKANREAVMEAQKAIHELAMEGASEEAIRQAANELADAAVAEALEMAQGRNALRDILTEEQLAQLEEIKEQARDRRGEMLEQRKGRRQERNQRDEEGPRGPAPARRRQVENRT